RLVSQRARTGERRQKIGRVLESHTRRIRFGEVDERPAAASLFQHSLPQAIGRQAGREAGGEHRSPWSLGLRSWSVLSPWSILSPWFVLSPSPVLGPRSVLGS